MMLDAASAGAPLNSVDGTFLVKIAVATVAARLTGRPVPDQVPNSAALTAPGAAFVTLEALGRLRGCVGTIEPVRPLYLDVIRNAQRSMEDPRLPRVTAADWPDLDIKVSVLHPAGPLPAGRREELVAALRPGVDGVLLSDGVRRSTFLPAVWEKLSDPDRFIDALLAKGGWPDGWPGGLVASRYTTVEFADKAPRDPLV